MPEVKTPERIDIRGLAIEVPQVKKNAPFNPERDISDEQWHQMGLFLLELALDKNNMHSYRRYGRILFHMHALSPERVTQSRVYMDPEIIEKAIQEASSANDLVDYAHHALPLKTMFPKNFARLFNISGQPWQMESLGSRMQEFQKESSMVNFLEDLVSLKIVKPENFENLTSKVPDFNNQSLFNAAAMSLINNTAEFIALAAETRLLFPETEFEYPTNFWVQAREVLKSAAEGSREPWLYFARCAYHLKILAAEKVKVDEKGIHLTMPLEEIDPSPLPERRSF